MDKKLEVQKDENVEVLELGKTPAGEIVNELLKDKLDAMTPDQSGTIYGAPTKDFTNKDGKNYQLRDSYKTVVEDLAVKIVIQWFVETSNLSSYGKLIQAFKKQDLTQGSGYYVVADSTQNIGTYSNDFVPQTGQFTKGNFYEKLIKFAKTGDTDSKLYRDIVAWMSTNLQFISTDQAIQSEFISKIVNILKNGFEVAIYDDVLTRVITAPTVDKSPQTASADCMLAYTNLKNEISYMCNGSDQYNINKADASIGGTGRWSKVDPSKLVLLANPNTINAIKQERSVLYNNEIWFNFDGINGFHEVGYVIERTSDVNTNVKTKMEGTDPNFTPVKYLADGQIIVIERDAFVISNVLSATASTLWDTNLTNTTTQHVWIKYATIPFASGFKLTDAGFLIPTAQV